MKHNFFLLPIFVLLVGNLFATAPAINSFSPSSGAVGTLVTITGTNLSSLTAFTIGGTAAIAVSNSGTTLVGMVMPGASTGAISITTAGGTATGTGNFSVTATLYPGGQQGSKLVGTGNIGAANQGSSVAISADGNTAIVGGYFDNTAQGAAWIYTRSGSTWTQQGNKLVGTGKTDYPRQGSSVAISADGNTVIVGGYTDNNSQGAVWIFTRSGSSWTQQGTKLVGTGYSGQANQGSSVALSADGNTAIVGGNGDNYNVGAAWVFIRSGGSWSQQGNKLVGSGYSGQANQGSSVALSADGNTAIVGGYYDNSGNGAAWVFTRSGSSWSQQGSKLVGSGGSAYASQGTSVALSADGNTAIVGGYWDNSGQGAVWVWTRSGGSWSQQGNKLVGSGNTGSAGQGISVSLSADGNTAIVGGSVDNSNQGATWVYTRSGSIWSQQGSKLVGTGNAGYAYQGVSVSLSADGNTVIVGGYNDNSGNGAAWVFVPCSMPVIVSQSTATQSQCINGTFTPISVTVTGPGLTTYQWYSNASNSNSGGTSLGSGNGAQTNSYIPQASASGTLYYYCVISGTCGTATSAVSGAFIVNPVPAITAFTPATGPVGTLVTLTGTNLSNTSSFSIGGIPAIVVSNNGTTLAGMVMPGATTGSIVITTPAGCTVTSSGNFTVTATPYPALQQGNKLLGSGNAGPANQGQSVAVSADGNTAIVGGVGDAGWIGAAWVYTRSGSSWTQQGTKLVGTGYSGQANQGSSVALSADGNTAIVGGYYDNSGNGAAWVFTRSGSSWSQQGSKLLGTGNTGAAYQGWSVSLSADGNTALVGGYADNSNQGATWVFTRSGTSWSQQGIKLVGTGGSADEHQGYSVSLSANGNTAIVGGYFDNSQQGAAWVFTRTESGWSQQGSKLVASGGAAWAQQGKSVSLSADGNTALLGAEAEEAAWVFTRSAGIWTQQGKLTGTGGSNSHQGNSVALSADGNTAMVGGSYDNSMQGAVWVYSRSGNSWSQKGSKLVGTGNTGAAQQGISVSLSADGNTALEGGIGNNSNQGAAWVFVPCVIPVIISQSTQTQTQCIYGPFQSISVTAAGYNLSYQWYSNTSNSNSGGTSLGSGNGAQTNTCTPQANSAGTLYYYCVVTGNCGTVKSTVSGAFITKVATAINSQSTDAQTQQINGVFTAISVSATGAGTLTYQWYSNASNSNSGGTSLGSANGAQSNTYTPQANGLGILYYYCVVTGDCGTATSGVSGAFTVNMSFTPATGPVGTLLTISGASLNSLSSFTVGGTAAIVVSNNGTTLVGMVMPGTATGAVSITTSQGTFTSTGNFTVTATPNPALQQGNKLVGTGNTGAAFQGGSIAISADGNTAIVGGSNDNSGQGAAWIFTRSGSSWSQQGSKLVGSGNTGAAYQGCSVAISADGNTAIVGGRLDNNNQGAAWVFTRSGSSWSQQGSKLFGVGSSGPAEQGHSVAISADGNTAVVGGPRDNMYNLGNGAAWVFSRSAGIWTQYGGKLVGTGGDFSGQGGSVAISADGNTAIVGGYYDHFYQGAAWVFHRSGVGGIWSQQGSKLVGTGGSTYGYQGRSVAISADGNTAIVGGFTDNGNQGASWVWTRSGGAWSQQGSKLVGSGNVGAAQQGTSVALSADGKMAIVGGPEDNIYQGAAWVFAFSGSSWTQQGSKLSGTGVSGAARQGGSVALSADGATAIVGGSQDNSFQGAAWVFVPCYSPAISSQSTAAQTRCVNGTFSSISVSATGSGLSYQWYSNASSSNSGGISLGSGNGAQTNSYTPQAAATGTLYYYCVVTGTCGTATSTVSGAFNTNTATTISSQSTATQTQCISGTFTAITVTATGTGSLTYQWYSNATNSNSGGISLGSGNGAQTNSYTPQAAATGTLYYYCVVTGTCGTATSTVSGAFITNVATAISSQSTATQTQCISGTFDAITVTATGPGLSYQWYSNATNSNSGGASLGTGNGAQTNSYTPQAAAAGTLYYYCVVTGTCGTATSAVSGAFVTTSLSPTITSFTPTSAATGTTVTITGTNFTNASAVSFGGTAATSYNVASATSITAVVAGGATGSVSVTTPGGTATSSGTFTYISCSNPTDGGIISGMQTICSGFIPALFSSTSDASGQVGTLEYKWQKSTMSNSSGFIDISSSNAATYASGALIVTSWFKRLSRVACMSDWLTAAESNVLEVTVNQPSFSAQIHQVSDLVANGTDIKWYDAATGGNLLSSGTVLVNNQLYYASQTVNGVESTDRLEVSVTLDLTPCAPAGTATQTFSTGSTVSSLQATGSSIRWYAASNGGTALATSTVLVDGTHYYASQTVNCTESATRLDVTVAIGP